MQETTKELKVVKEEKHKIESEHRKIERKIHQLTKFQEDELLSKINLLNREKEESKKIQTILE